MIDNQILLLTLIDQKLRETLHNTLPVPQTEINSCKFDTSV